MMKPCMDCGSTDGIHGSNCATHEREPATGKPSWNEAPDWAEWLGQDGDGAWFWFEREPERQESCWGQSQGQIEFAAAGYLTVSQDWRQTLERRPDDSFIVESMVGDAINPNHYRQGGIECIEALKAATVGKTGIEAVCVANVIKYLWRYEEKNGRQDVEKACWYLDRLLRELEP